jgi:hypothetical protein
MIEKSDYDNSWEYDDDDNWEYDRQGDWWGGL